MTLYELIQNDVKEAMKAKDELRTSALRMAHAACKNKQIEFGHALSDEEVQGVIKTMVKQYQDALHDFEQANREDLVMRQRQEIEVIKTYLPMALEPAELENLVRVALKDAAVTDIGRAMGVAMKVVGNRASGGEVRAIVERLFKE